MSLTVSITNKLREMGAEASPSGLVGKAKRPTAMASEEPTAKRRASFPGLAQMARGKKFSRFRRSGAGRKPGQAKKKR